MVKILTPIRCLATSSQQGEGEAPFGLLSRVERQGRNHMVSADVKYMSRGPGETSSLAGGEESLGPPASQRRGIGGTSLQPGHRGKFRLLTGPLLV